MRQRLGRPMGLAEKVLLAHLDDPSNTDLERGKSYVQLRPDRVILQDVLGQTAMLQFMQTRRTQTAVPTSVHCDHLIQARVEGASDLRESLAENREVYDFLRTAAAKYGVGFWGPGAGIIHQVALEEYAFPGELIIGTDSHTPMAGGLGACAVGVGGADAVEVMAGCPGRCSSRSFIGVYLTGEMSGWTAPKDVILKLAGELTVSGGTNAIIEYFGPGARSISATGKATITNMGAELGATTSIFPYDQRMAKYLAATGRGELAKLADQYSHLLMADKEIEANPDGYFDRIVEIDLSKLEPHIVGPHSPDRARPISQLAAEVKDPKNQFVDEISTALIGSCTNSSYEDMSRAADVAEQARAHGVKAAVPFMVTPGSEQVRATIERDGQMASLKAIDGTVLANACGPCIGQWRRSQETVGRGEHHCHVLQPQLPHAQRRPADHHELHRQSGDCHGHGAGRQAVVQSPDRYHHRSRWQALQAASRPSLLQKCQPRTSTRVTPRTSRLLRMAAISRCRWPRTASGCSCWSRGRPGTVKTSATCRC